MSSLYVKQKLPFLWHCLTKTASLEIFNTNYFFCSERGDLQRQENLRKTVKAPYVSCLFRYLRSLAKGVWLLARKRQPVYPPVNGIALSVQSGNNVAALEPVRRLYPDDAYFVGPSAYASVGPSIHGAAWVSVLFIPCFLWRWVRGTAYEKRSMAYALDTTLLAYGYYFLSSLWLKKHAPRLVIFANDHSFFPRVFRAAALDMGVKTLYLQHASVTSKFPALDFDYACLDGRDSLEKYRQAGPIKSTVFLTGMAKSAQMQDRINNKERVESIGICVNTLDDLEQIKPLAVRIQAKFPDLPMIWRPHPAMKSRFEMMRNWGKAHNIQFSDPSGESVWDFMGRIDLLLAGNSSVHVEATLLNITSIYVDFGDGRGDYYGYLQTGVVDQYEGDALFEVIGKCRIKKPNVRFRAGYYCADIGTDFEGRPDFLLECALKTILDGCDVSDVFKKTVVNGNCVYAPYHE